MPFPRLLLMAVVAATAVLVAACSGNDDDADSTTSTPAAGTASPSVDPITDEPTGTDSEFAEGVLIDGYIGTATMEADRTIILHLRSELPDGSVGQGTLTYPTNHAQYETILDHVEPISPGQTVDVLPFP